MTNLLTMNSHPKQPVQGPWLFHRYDKVYTQLLFVGSDLTPYDVLIPTEMSWPFLYLDTAYWHALDLSRPQLPDGRVHVEYLDFLRVSATQQLLLLPAGLVPTETWVHVGIASRDYKENHSVNLPSESYLSPFQNHNFFSEQKELSGQLLNEMLVPTV